MARDVGDYLPVTTRDDTQPTILSISDLIFASVDLIFFIHKVHLVALPARIIVRIHFWCKIKNRKP